jgi:hypothetical protein
MSNESTEKYKLFRNYMCNELGITRADIEAWTKEATAVEVNKKLGQINIPKLVSEKIANEVRSSLGASYSSTALSKDIAAELAKSLKVVAASASA